MWKKISLIIFICIPTILLAQSFEIVQKPIIWNEDRERLSLEYLRDRHGMIQDRATIVPAMVVVHWTANNSVEKTFDLFNPVELPGRPELTKASKLNVSSQYVIDRDGTIYQFLADTTFARHTIGLNYCAIGIENIGSERNPLTKEQLIANEKLIRSLVKKYPIKYMLGHVEYYQLRETSVWKEADPNYITFKIDPGHVFMYKLRKRLKDLKLQEKLF
ncbi:N-acetylmuramoyl-L-alanine amidase [Sphingobacterium alkalisoli]|uniref:N-acetylmuramoyl-L-alanine amidase n=2 Tax=Sphingobacterium alkalisoli TaxID=1874115 RepID=A0A4U0HDN1_9SPHI|nr:N-acetylmuramoyl-L-alanine amidase [Sphingobacterium alkalisoli]